MGLKDMMGRVAAGLKGKPPEDQGPVGHAVEILRSAIRQAKESNLWGKEGTLSGSPILGSAEILLDYAENTRKANLVAVDLVDAFEDQGEWTPEKAKLIMTLIAKFKLACVKARMHQYVPEKKAEPVVNPEATA
jgi:hypothetical protein